MDATADLGNSLIMSIVGRVLSAVFVELTDNYVNHLGLSRNDFARGANKFESIMKVDYAEAMAFRFPLFDRAYAGIENVPGSGVKHTLILNLQGRA